ncbi:hypothetical protein ACFQ3R_08215 [Mesonia ostreae]|uniref:Uncharacterized protein n=1 Tax=Mesonia ostreae TaxID=861110 RepID=A0ABU2KF53_9FLAO|nr:hypothetical protein [Mesonia ostreae]MDT0293345.1 hypothetical protein [Mesonia ostreae]
MKRAILGLLFICICNTCFGQTYSFDRLIKSEVSTTSSKYNENTYLFNSEDYSYSLRLNEGKDSTEAWIIDTKRRQVHYFNIKSKDSLELEFVQTNPYKLNLPKYTYEFSYVKSKSQEKEILLAIINKKKEEIAKYRLKIEKTDHNYFPIFQATAAVEPFNLMNIKAPFNFLVLKSYGKNAGGKALNYEMSCTEGTNFTVTIPQKS